MTGLTFARVHRVLLGVAVSALVALTVSGVWLTRYYRPWASVSGLRRRPGAVSVAVGVHRGAAAALLLCLGVLVGVRLVTAARRAVWPALATAAAVALVATGRRLAWAVLGLWAVRANLDAAGMLFAAFDDTVRFVVVGGTELSQGEFRTLLGVHAAVLPLVLVVLLILAQRARDRPTAPGT